MEIKATGPGTGETPEPQHTSDQIRFQKALLEAQGEASIDGILMVSPSGEILSCNRRFREIWHLPDEPLEGRQDGEVLGLALGLVADPDRFARRVKRLYAAPDERARDEIVLVDGRVLDRYSAPVRSPDGVAYGRIWYFRDITDARKGEAALRRSEQRFRSVVENASDLVTLIDPAGAILYQSPAIERAYGYGQEELIGKSAFDLVHPEDAEPLRTRLAEIIAHPGETRWVEFRFRHQDGQWVHVEAAGRTLSPSSAEDGVVVNSRDITDRKRAEVRLREATRFLENLIASSPGVIFRGSGETMQTTYISPNSRAVLGFTPEEFIENPHLWVEQTHPDDRAGVEAQLVQAVSTGQRLLTYEYRFQIREGTYRNLMASVRFERDGATGETEVLGYTFDVTPLKAAESALRYAQETVLAGSNWDTEIPTDDDCTNLSVCTLDPDDPDTADFVPPWMAVPAGEYDSERLAAAPEYWIEYLGTGPGRKGSCDTLPPSLDCQSPMFRVIARSRAEGRADVMLQANIISRIPDPGT